MADTALDELYLDNFKGINKYLDRHSNGKLRWKEIHMTLRLTVKSSCASTDLIPVESP